ncbi:MAG: Omp28-related outer membrane protein [Saprospiraceae bacterium]|nr:Omp28-related outer membrane protein [Saprospiraceae bacterium]
MKKHYFTVLIAVLFLVRGIAQQVEFQQRTLLTKRTADWCPYCGTWGWNFFKNAIEQNGDKAVYIAAHYDGNLSIDAATEITNNLGGGFQPRFFLNDADQGVSSGNSAAKLTSVKEQIDANFLQAPVANCGFEPKFAEGLLKVAAKVKFFETGEGEYSLGIYLLENNVTAFQASIGNNAVHQKLLRASFTDETFGQPIFNGNINQDQEFDLNFELELDEIQGHDYEVVGIIWKKEGSKYLPINVWGTNEITEESPSIIQSGELENRMTIAPSIITESAVVAIELVKEQQNANIELYDMNGRLVTKLYNGPLKSGNQTIRFDKTKIAAKGTHIVKLKCDGFEFLEKVIFQ